MLTPRSEREAMGKRARSLAERTYSRQLIIKEYEKLLISCIEKKSEEKT